MGRGRAPRAAAGWAVLLCAGLAGGLTACSGDDGTAEGAQSPAVSASVADPTTEPSTVLEPSVAPTAQNGEATGGDDPGGAGASPGGAPTSEVQAYAQELAGSLEGAQTLAAAVGSCQGLPAGEPRPDACGSTAQAALLYAQATEAVLTTQEAPQEVADVATRTRAAATATAEAADVAQRCPADTRSAECDQAYADLAAGLGQLDATLPDWRGYAF